MATRASELVQARTIVGSREQVQTALRTAERRGVIRGRQFAVAQLEDGRWAVKVLIASPAPARRRIPSRRQTIVIGVALIGLTLVGSVVWLIVRTVQQLATWTGHHAGPIVGVVVVLVLIALLGGRGGGTFSGTFSGRWH